MHQRLIVDVKCRRRGNRKRLKSVSSDKIDSYNLENQHSWNLRSASPFKGIPSIQ